MDSDVFAYFSLCFHQDIFVEHTELNDAIDSALSCLRPQQQQELKEQVATMLTEMDDAALLEAWNTSKADFYLDNSRDARRFFEMVQTRIPESVKHH